MKCPLNIWIHIDIDHLVGIGIGVYKNQVGLFHFFFGPEIAEKPCGIDYLISYFTQIGIVCFIIIVAQGHLQFISREFVILLPHSQLWRVLKKVDSWAGSFYNWFTGSFYNSTLG
ncbi:hypothetical protein HR10_08130 [Porphyromonas gulae]|nr:hypothetical protein HR10_08130 [Porphyromonas gulae]